MINLDHLQKKFNLDKVQDEAKTFTPNDVFRIFGNLSEISQIQNSLLKDLLRMVGSLIKKFNVEENEQDTNMVNKYISSNYPNKQNYDNINTQEANSKLNIQEIDIPPNDDQCEVTSLNLSSMSASLPLNQILRLEAKVFAKKDPPNEVFKKQFTKIIKQNQHKKKVVIKEERLQVPIIGIQEVFGNAKQVPKSITKDKVFNEVKERLFKQTIRNKEERKQLPGHMCTECQPFIDGLNLSEEEKLKWCQDCSRHRGWNNNIQHQDIHLFPSPMR